MRWIVLAAIAAMETALILAATLRYGSGLSVDSAAYVSVARQLLAGHGFALFDGAPLVEFPPLYPLVLAAVAGLAGLDPLEIARFGNALLAGVLAALCAWWGMRMAEGKRLLPALTALAVPLSIPIFHTSIMVWSEPLFSVLVLGALFALERVVSGGGVRSWGALTALSAAACLTRYAGVGLVAAALPVLLVGGSGSARRRLLRGVGYAALALLPLGLWCLRNHALTGTIFGRRAPSSVTLEENAGRAIHTVLAWALPERVIGREPLLAAFAVVVLALVVLSGPRLWRLVMERAPALAPLALFAAAWGLLLVLTSTLAAYDPIGDRLLSAAYAPIALLALWAVSAIASSSGSGIASRLTRWSSIGLLGAWVLYAGSIVGRDTWKAVREGAGGFNSRVWRTSPTLAAARRRLARATGPIYSNMPEALYLLAGIRAKLSPVKGGATSSIAGAPVTAYEKVWPAAPAASLVWFHGRRAGDVHAPDTLRAIARVTLRQAAADGAIYLVEDRTP